MLAWRTTWVVKQGRMQEALEMLQAVGENPPASYKGQVRIYTPNIGPDVLVFEEAWERAEEHDKFWAEWRTTSEHDAFFERWHKVVERSVGSDRWNLTEWK